MEFRRLSDLAPSDLSAYASPGTRLLELATLPGHKDLLDYFTDYPDRALSLPPCRAFMYELVRAVRPQIMVEIGTYFAGTTEIIARALWANGNDGKLITIDPFGGDRVPGLLAQWPADLQNRVIFSPANSMQLFMEFERIRPKIDIAFVDGDHSYGFALYDLVLAAKWVRPGGIIIMDDFNQPGVFWATKHFLERNPAWREISGVFDDYDAGAPFASMRPSIEGTEYLVLAAPEEIEVGDSPLSTEYEKGPEKGIEGFQLEISPGSGGGTLHAQVFLRSFYHDGADGGPEQLETTLSARVQAGETSSVIKLKEPLITTFDPSKSSRQVEIVLLWQPDTHRETLKITKRPEPVLIS